MKHMSKIAVFATVITVLCSLMIFPSSAATYSKLGTIYMAEQFLTDDTKPAALGTNTEKFMGVNQSPVTGGSYLDTKDKKEGNSSLVQKCTTGGDGLSFWLSSDKFTEAHGGAPGNVAAYKNPGIHMWIFVSNPKNIGGDRSGTDDAYGSIQVDIGNDSGAGVNANANRNFWIDANVFTAGWNELVIPLKPEVSAKGQFVFDGKTIGTKFSANMDWSNLNWFRMNITSKAGLMIKIDDIYWCDLGNNTAKPAGSDSTESTTSSQSASSKAESQSASSKATDNNNSTAVSSAAAGESENTSVTSTDNNASGETSDVIGDESVDASSDASSTAGSKAGDNDDEKKDNSMLLIIGIIVGVLALGGIATAVVLTIMKSKKPPVPPVE